MLCRSNCSARTSLLPQSPKQRMLQMHTPLLMSSENSSRTANPRVPAVTVLVPEHSRRQILKPPQSRLNPSWQELARDVPSPHFTSFLTFGNGSSPLEWFPVLSLSSPRGTLTHTNLTISPPLLPRHGIQTVTQHAKQLLYQQKHPQPFYFERASPSVAQMWHLSLALSSLGHLGFPNPPPHPSSNPTTPNPQAPISPCSGHGLFLSEILQKALSFGSGLQRAS